MAPPSREISARQMNLADSVKPPTDLMSGRFFLIGYLPTYAAAGFLLTLIWAGGRAQINLFGVASMVMRAARHNVPNGGDARSLHHRRCDTR
jgi:hypothetical protein